MLFFSNFPSCYFNKNIVVIGEFIKETLCKIIFFFFLCPGLNALNTILAYKYRQLVLVEKGLCWKLGFLVLVLMLVALSLLIYRSRSLLLLGVYLTWVFGCQSFCGQPEIINHMSCDHAYCIFLEDSKFLLV